MNASRRTQLLLQPLESRDAPASASVTYTDIDGDVVKLVASVRGEVAPPLDMGDLTFTDGNPDGQLARLALTDPLFQDASVTFCVTRKAGGDGLAHVGFIDAASRDLDRVTVKGDLGRIVAGDWATSLDPGVNVLRVRSMGLLGLSTQGGTGTLKSKITGAMGALKVTGDFCKAELDVTADAFVDGQIGSVLIGGDFVSGPVHDSGRIQSTGAIGNVRIRGGVLIDPTGFPKIWSGGTLGNVYIGGGLPKSLIAATGAMGHFHVGGAFAGSVFASSMGRVRIGGNVVEGTIISSTHMGDVRVRGELRNSFIESTTGTGDVRVDGSVVGGRVVSNGPMGNVRITGDLIGGDLNDYSDSSGVVAGSVVGHVRIGGDVLGGNIGGTPELKVSGAIQGGRIASVSVGGSLVAGLVTTDPNFKVSLSGAIAADVLGPVRIGGSVIGNNTHAATISAKGVLAQPAGGFETAIASIRIGGDVRIAKILAGCDSFGFARSADASIGSVRVGGNWVASSLVAGAQDGGVAGFGVGDALQPGGDPAVVARIASVSIDGEVLGSNVAGDHFGFVAERIDRFRIGSRAFALARGPSNDNLAIPLTSDVRLLEVS